MVSFFSYYCYSYLCILIYKHRNIQVPCTPLFYFLGLFPMLLESFHKVCACDCRKLFSMCFLLSVLVSGPATLGSVIRCELTLMNGERQGSRFILLCLETSYLTPVLKLVVLSPMYVFENFARITWQL